MELDEETKRLLVGALTHHPEFLDIWKGMNEGEPDTFVEMSTSTKQAAEGTRRRRLEELNDERLD